MAYMERADVRMYDLPQQNGVFVFPLSSFLKQQTEILLVCECWSRSLLNWLRLVDIYANVLNIVIIFIILFTYQSITMKLQSISRFCILCQDTLRLVLDLKCRLPLLNFLCVFIISSPIFEEPHFHNVIQELRNSLHSNHYKANYRQLLQQGDYNVSPKVQC